MALSKLPYKGTRDFFPADMRLRNFLFQKMAEVSELFGYEPYDGPMIEEVELYLAKSGEELINDQIYSFIDRGDRKVAIRPEMTPTVARMVAQVHREIPKPIRWYAIPNLMRYEKPQKGRLREFWQYNADIFGAQEGLGEFEMLELIVKLFTSFGANENHFEILINDRRFVDHFVKKEIGLTDETQIKAFYKLVDKAKKLKPEVLEAEISKLVNNNLAQRKSIQKYLALEGNFHFTNLEVEHQPFLNLIDRIKNHPLLKKYVKFDPSIVRGLDYYTGFVFEVFSKNLDLNRALAGGGAYSNLLKIFNEEPVHGVGIGLGEVPLTEFLKELKLLPDFSQSSPDVLIGYLSTDAEYKSMELSSALRDAGIKTELILGESKPKKVFSLAERNGHKFIIMLGSNEIQNNQVELNHQKTRTKKMISLKSYNELIQVIKEAL